MLEVRLLDDGGFHISGYVNITEKPSRVLTNSKGEKFVERVESRCFAKALSRGNNVKLLLNHNHNIHLGSLDEGNVKLSEDNIGLKIEATVNHPEVRKAFDEGGFSGYSYGFNKIQDEYRDWDNGLKLRTLKDINLIEVSLLDSKTTPAYFGSIANVETRSQDGEELELRAFSNELEEVKEELNNCESENSQEVRTAKFDDSCFFDAQNFIKTRQ